jgi:hypothetical protein
MIKIKPLTCFVAILVAFVVVITAYNGLKGHSKTKSFSETSECIEETQIGEIVADTNEQEIESPQQIEIGVKETEESAFIELLKQEEQDKLRSLDEAAIELENEIVEKRKEIESWYLSELERLKVWAERRTKELDEDAKMAYARCLQKMENTVSSSVAVGSSDTYGYANTYYSPYGYATTDGYAYTDEVKYEVTEKTVVGNPVEDYKLELENIKESHRAVDDVFSELLQKRERYLWNLEVYTKNRRAAIEAQKQHVKKNSEVKLRGGPGVVDAISCSGERPCIMFSSEVLYEGDYANGLKRMAKFSYNISKTNPLFFRPTCPRKL